MANDPAKVNGNVAYTLDPVGNRLSQSSSLAGINSLSFSYNPDDELGGETYDADGNVTETGGKSFAYDSQNELVSMNGGAVSLVYDGDDNRVAETASGVTTRYLVDDLNPTGYAQVVEETVNGAPQREYTYGLQRIDEDQVVNSAWTVSYYGYDGFGTVRQLTNAAGAVTDTYEYDAFGNEITSTGSTPNEMLYRGEQYDSNLGLYYLRARYYNLMTGSFMSRDPEAGDPAVPATLHRYLYAGADPVDVIDPTGRDLFETALIEGGSLRAPALPALTEVAGGTATTIGAWMTAVQTGITEISADMADAATEAGPAAWNSITSAVNEFNALMAEEGLMGGITKELVCADLGLVVGQIVDTASQKPWLGHTVDIVEDVGCTIALHIKQ